MESKFTIDKNITEIDIEYIEGWLKKSYEKGIDNFYGNVKIIKEYFNDGDFLLYRNNGNVDGFLIYSKLDKKVRLEIICIKPDLRHKGVGKKIVLDYIKYFSDMGLLIVEVDNVVTCEGVNLCLSTNFIKLNKPNEESMISFYKPLIDVCRGENWNANRRMILWKKESIDSSTIPDSSWSLDFEEDKTPILEYAYKDWWIGIVEDNRVIEYDKVKYFYNVTSKTNGYLYVNKDVFKRC